jgi:hypothetical protein
MSKPYARESGRALPNARNEPKILDPVLDHRLNRRAYRLLSVGEGHRNVSRELKGLVRAHEAACGVREADYDRRIKGRLSAIAETQDFNVRKVRFHFAPFLNASMHSGEQKTRPVGAYSARDSGFCLSSKIALSGVKYFLH